MTECVFKKPYKFNDRRQSARECNELKKKFIRQPPKEEPAAESIAEDVC